MSLVNPIYLGVAHRGHDAMGTSIQRPLDHPFFGNWDANNRACILGTNGVIKLCIIVNYMLSFCTW